MPLPDLPKDTKPSARTEDVASILLKVALELTPHWGRSLTFLTVITVVGLIAASIARTDIQVLAIVDVVLFVDIIGLLVARSNFD